MAFTFAHPGYALYIQRKYFSFLNITALVFGSIAPDIDILIRVTDLESHIFNYHLREVFFIILPIALFMSIAFNLLCRKTLIQYLPDPLRRKFIDSTDYNIRRDLTKNLPFILLSLIVGIYLHLFIDLLSHWNAHHVMMFFHVGFYPIKAIMPVTYYGAWYLPIIISTVFGFWLTVEYSKLEWNDFSQLFRRLKPRVILFWIIFTAVAILVAILKSMVLGLSGRFALHHLSIHITSGLLFSLFATPVMFRIFARPSANEE